MIYAENILLCIAIPLLVSLLFLHGETKQYVAAFLLGMTVCLISAYIDGYLDLVTGMGGNDTAIFISPVIEELMKFLPLVLFMILLVPEDGALTMLSAAIGAGFATFENCCYILSEGAGSLPYIFIRGLAVGVMHIVSLLSLSIWLTIIKRLRVFSFPSITIGVSIATIFHALYNLLVSEPGLSSIIGYSLPLFTAIILSLLYRRLSIRSGMTDNQ